MGVDDLPPPPEGFFEAPLPSNDEAPKKRSRRGPLRVVDGAKTPAEWREGLLTRTSRGGKEIPRACVANVMHVLERHPAWDGVIAFDELREAPVTLKAPPVRVGDKPHRSEPGEWTDEDTVRTVAWISEVVELDVGVETVDRAVIAVARKRSVHAVRDYLHGLTWDGTKRVATWMTDYIGSEATAYTQAVGRAWMLSAVARVERPGAQVDHLLVLEGPQAAGKSSALRVLGGAWLNESPIEITDAREAGQALRGFWIVVFDELDSLRRAEARRVKAFLTLTADTYRPSYGRRARSFPRQCVFAATTNESNYLVDGTGNRRFWPVRVGKIDLDGLRRDRDQLWAEARALFDAGEPWYITDASVERLARAEQATREEEDPWTTTLDAWLAEQASRYAHGVSTSDVLTRALGLDARDLTRTNSTRAGEVLRRLGWVPRQRRENGERVRRYLPAQPSVDGRDSGRDDDESKNTAKSHVTTCHNVPVGVHEREGDGEHAKELTGSACDSRDGSDVVTGDAAQVSLYPEREVLS